MRKEYALDVLMRQKEIVAKAYNRKVKPKKNWSVTWFGKSFFLWAKNVEFWENGHLTRKVPFESLRCFQIIPMRLKRLNQNVEPWG